MNIDGNDFKILYIRKLAQHCTYKTNSIHTIRRRSLLARSCLFCTIDRKNRLIYIYIILYIIYHRGQYCLRRIVESILSQHHEYIKMRMAALYGKYE